MRRKACLIFNPISGQSDPGQDLVTIWKVLEPGIQLTVYFTSELDDPADLASKAIASGVDMVLAAGGDGTVAAVAAALIKTNIPLGIIPRGTANAFSVALGLPTTVQAACEVIATGVPMVVDAASCNGKPMILLAGIGFEAEAVENADREAKNRFGSLAYIWSGIGQLLNLQPFDVQLHIEGTASLEPEPNKFRAIAVTVANAAPPTSVMAQGPNQVIANDGLLDITIVTSATRLAALNAISDLLGSALDETASDREDITYLRTRALTVTTEPPQKVVLDGEIIGTTPVEIKCIPGGLTILAPSPVAEEV